LQSLVQQEEGLLFCMVFTGFMLRRLLIDGDESLANLEAVRSICNRASKAEDLTVSEEKQTTQINF